MTELKEQILSYENEDDLERSIGVLKRAEAKFCTQYGGVPDAGIPYVTTFALQSVTVPPLLTFSKDEEQEVDDPVAWVKGRRNGTVRCVDAENYTAGSICKNRSLPAAIYLEAVTRAYSVDLPHMRKAGATPMFHDVSFCRPAEAPNVNVKEYGFDVLRGVVVFAFSSIGKTTLMNMNVNGAVIDSDSVIRSEFGENGTYGADGVRRMKDGRPWPEKEAISTISVMMDMEPDALFLNNVLAPELYRQNAIMVLPSLSAILERIAARDGTNGWYEVVRVKGHGFLDDWRRYASERRMPVVEAGSRFLYDVLVSEGYIKAHPVIDVPQSSISWGVPNRMVTYRYCVPLPRQVPLLQRRGPTMYEDGCNWVPISDEVMMSTDDSGFYIPDENWYGYGTFISELGKRTPKLSTPESLIERRRTGTSGHALGALMRPTEEVRWYALEIERNFENSKHMYGYIFNISEDTFYHTWSHYIDAVRMVKKLVRGISGSRQFRANVSIMMGLSLAYKRL